MAKKVSIMEHLTNEELETSKEFKSKISAVKESGYFAKSMRESIYGTKTRTESKVEQVGDIWNAKEAFNEWLADGTKKGTAKKNNKEPSV